MKQRIPFRHSFPAALLLIAVVAGVAHAASPPGLVHYQGVLRDDQNLPLDGSFDMTFRFFDQAVGGNEILVDTHAAGQAVVVTDGLFSVALGGGLVSDGAAVLPSDPHTLPSTFENFDEVWLEIEIEGETLSPRTRVMSAAYALNAGSLNGLQAGDFLDTTANDQVKTGELTLGGLSVQGDIHLIDPFFKSITFEDGGGTQAFRWDDADHIFELTDGIQSPGPLVVGNPAFLPQPFNRFGTSTDPQSGNIGSGNDLFVGDDFEAFDDGTFGGNLEVNGTGMFNANIWVDDDGPDGDQRVRFWNDGGLKEELKWDDAGDRFEFSDSLAIAGSLRTGQTTETPEGFNHLGDLDDAPDSDDMSGTQDLYVEGDVEIEDSIYLGGEIFMLDLGPDLDGNGSGDDIDQFIFFYDNQVMDDEWIKWDNSASSGTGGTVDRFEMSDSLHVYGDLTALNKNFVQNYPGREDLEIVYTTLEGDEATVFTRGHAALQGGVARVPLGPTFPLVANPDMGLTAHLTPRGDWSDLYVVELTPDELVVGVRDGTAGDIAFDYIVYGLRLGYEDQPVIRPRRGEAPIPTLGHWDNVYAAMPDAREFNARSRYVAMKTGALGREADVADSHRATDLRKAIGQGILDGPTDENRRRSSADGDNRVSQQPAAHVPEPVEPVERPGTVAAASAPPARSGAEAGTDSPSDMVARSFRPERGGVAVAWDGDGAIEPGDVVVVDPKRTGGMRRADRTEDPTVIGIATGSAGVLFGAAGTAGEARGEGDVAVALSGIVLCKVDAGYGAIAPGDLLVASATPGHARRQEAPLPGTVVGKALEPLDEGTGTIRVLVVQR